MTTAGAIIYVKCDSWEPRFRFHERTYLLNVLLCPLSAFCSLRWDGTSSYMSCRFCPLEIYIILWPKSIASDGWCILGIIYYFMIWMIFMLIFMGREVAVRSIPFSSSAIPCPRLLPKLMTHDKILLVSYPRSGNSMLRQCFETMTRTVTGSDSRPNRTLSSALLRCGYRGEGLTDNSVWMVKSHYPERLGFIKFRVDRVVLLVRNPFDAITSYFHMAMTNTHHKNLSSAAFESVRYIYVHVFCM